MFGKWFKGKRSKGGSEIYKHDNSGEEQSKMGFQENLDQDYAAFREKCYIELWGEPDKVYHELVPFIPHIDVYTFPPGDGREWWILATSGMSDLPMTLPEAVDPAFSRVELILYTKTNDERYLEFLRNLAHFPHDNKTWFGPGHTFPNGTPPEPIFENSNLDTILFIHSIISPDNKMCKKFEAKGWAFDLLHPTPITTAECDYKLEKGMDAVYDLLSENRHPFILNEQRPSYI